MLKKQQKMTKINQKNAILMSEKILVTFINKGVFSKIRVRIVNPLKQGLKQSGSFHKHDSFFEVVRIVNPLK